MNYSDQEFEEDFRLVFAISKKAKSLPKQKMAQRVKQHSMSAARENQVVFKITSFSESSTSIRKTLAYNSRKGDLNLFDNMENELDVSSGTSAYRDFSNEIKWLNVGQHKTKRLTMNFVLSLSEGASKVEFEESTRDFLNRHFGNQPYLYTFHDDTDHYHAHVVAGLRNYDGERIITSKAQLFEWRQGFAESLRLRGIKAEATPALSRGEISQNTELKSKNRILERGELLSANGKLDQAESVQESIDKRLDAWKRIHQYMKEHALDGENELLKYIEYTYYHRNMSLEQDL